jgi:hypothetical protein
VYFLEIANKAVSLELNKFTSPAVPGPCGRSKPKLIKTERPAKLSRIKKCWRREGLIKVIIKNIIIKYITNINI